MSKDSPLAIQVARLAQFSQKMTHKLMDPSQVVTLNVSVLSEEFSKFFSAANSEVRARFSYHLQKQFHLFLKNFALKRLKRLSRDGPEAYSFIEEICEIWNNYERFVYAIKFFTSAADNTYKTFHKFGGKFDTFLKNELDINKGNAKYSYEVAPVPVMAANHLRNFLKQEAILDSLISNFSKIFCAFLKQEREGLNTPRQKINEALEFVEALHLDYECDCVKKADRYRVIKALSANVPINRKSTANEFFIKNFTKKIFEDSQVYYQNWVDKKALNMLTTDELKEIIKLMDQEENRAKFYIHDSQNEKTYLDIVETNLIEYRMEERLRKTNGLQSFLANYELDKPESMEDVGNLWKVYKRIYFKPNESKNIINSIYENYLIQELRNIAKFVDKPPDFIQQSINLNKKNVQIVAKLLDGLHDFDRLRYERLEDSLAMKYVNETRDKEKGKEPMTASKHWASFIHNKIKSKYLKNQKYNEAQDGDIVGLFKLLVYKTIAVNEYGKYLCQRLLEDIDLSLQAQYSNAYAIETKIIEQMKNASSENEVKFISSCLRDVKNSFDLRIKLKESKNLVPFPFFNQIIRKTGKHWAETPVYDIKTPNALLKCRDALKMEMQNEKQLFEYFNGGSLFKATFQGQVHKFNLKNIYLMILMHIDESPGKKMYFPDLKKAIKPFGSSEVRAMLELIKYLLELCCFGLITCNRPMTGDICDPDSYTASDYFEINMKFKPTKPLPSYRTINIMMSLTEELKRKINEKVGSASMDEKNYEKDRRIAVELCTVKVLKHSQTLDGGKGTITFDEILRQQHRQHNVDQKYLKEVIESLINRDVCARVEGKKNTYRYVS